MIATWGMGSTQHKPSLQTVQMLSNLLMMRGNIGREGAGLCPVRGHSNVQGNRTLGIEEQPTQAFLDRLGQVFRFDPPRKHGLEVVNTIEKMIAGEVKVFVGLGGNFAMAMPDPLGTFDVLRSCQLTVHIATLGRSSLLLVVITRPQVRMNAGHWRH